MREIAPGNKMREICVRERDAKIGVWEQDAETEAVENNPELAGTLRINMVLRNPTQEFQS